MEINRATRSLFTTAVKAAGDGLTATERASLAASCQQNAMGLWGQLQYRSLPPGDPVAGGAPYDALLDTPKAVNPPPTPSGGVKICEVDEAA